VPIDDREWIAAYGPKTSLLTYHDIVSNNIDVLRSDTGGGPYAQISTAIPATDYKASNNQLGNIANDRLLSGQPEPGYRGPCPTSRTRTSVGEPRRCGPCTPRC